MPSNFTENYSLSQWEKSDHVLMDDFNADNAKLDAAIKAEADARTAAAATLTAQLSGKGNCQIWATSYIGSGKYNEANPTRVTFPSMPFMAFVVGSDGTVLVIPTVSGPGRFMGGSDSVIFSWSGNTVSWYCNYVDAQMAMLNVRYTVIGIYLNS